MHGFPRLRRNSSVAAAAVLVNERGQALVLKRGVTAPWLPGYWNLPGGSVDLGESPKHAAQRETEEEIELSPRNLRPLADWHDPEGWTLHTFWSTSWTGEPRVTWESDGFAWIGQAEVGHYRFVPGVAETLRAAFKLVA